MSVQIIQERLAAYACRSALEEEQALREITQEIILRSKRAIAKVIPIVVMAIIPEVSFSPIEAV